MNLATLSREIKAEYNPKTAFGNTKLINKLEKAEQLEAIKPEPGRIYDADGADLAKTFVLTWCCGNCEAEQEDEVYSDESLYYKVCDQCNAENKIDP